jgi:phosphoglycolate phosphatase-like HAD superfamily hydrolase
VASGILLDLDGTITDSSVLMATATAVAMRRCGIDPPEEGQLVRLVQHVSPMAILRHSGVPLGLYWAAYAENVGTSRAVAGLEDAIRSGTARGVRFGIVTSLPRPAACTLLHALKLDTHFNALITHGSTRRHKPYGDPVLAGAIVIGVEAPDCVYIGDQPADVAAGKAAGVGTVGVLWGFGEEDEIRAANPDVVLVEPPELIRFIDSL